MGVLALIGNLFKAFFFFANVWREKNKEKAEKKKVIANDIMEAFKETDPKLRASRLNAAVGRIKRV